MNYASDYIFSLEELKDVKSRLEFPNNYMGHICNICRDLKIPHYLDKVNSMEEVLLASGLLTARRDRDKNKPFKYPLEDINFESLVKSRITLVEFYISYLKKEAKAKAKAKAKESSK